MNTLMLGARAKTERQLRRWSLGDVCTMVEDMGAGKIAPGFLQRMEAGTRPGDPAVWAGIWQALRLPLGELYAGIGLPPPPELPTGRQGQVLALMEDMPEAAQALILAFARHAPGMATVVAVTKGIDKVPSLLHNKNVRADEEEGLDLRLRDDVREELVRERDRGYPPTRRKRGETDKPSGR